MSLSEIHRHKSQIIVKILMLIIIAGQLVYFLPADDAKYNIENMVPTEKYLQSVMNLLSERQKFP